MVDTTNWFSKVLRKDFTVGMVVSENGLDDPDQNFYENYGCGAARNYGGYCDRAVDALIDQQSMEADPEKRRRLVWDIERKLIEDDVSAGPLPPTCRGLQPALGEGDDPDGQRHLQRVALRGCLARQINGDLRRFAAAA